MEALYLSLGKGELRTPLNPKKKKKMETIV
jgi:hypothetical protein